ncbi:hypothetical protein K7X08_032063 [Anisodus acutangulus]|uniref:Uncharacterized protein n=1 Tax=Anisodus acutangulus TaxID=402998 RepID=A0A9Q1MMW1_9SOLA|nr:hypothetical protein K7X08_032063 [Anisodus acutangulus]
MKMPYTMLSQMPTFAPTSATTSTSSATSERYEFFNYSDVNCFNGSISVSEVDCMDQVECKDDMINELQSICKALIIESKQLDKKVKSLTHENLVLKGTITRLEVALTKKDIEFGKIRAKLDLAEATFRKTIEDNIIDTVKSPQIVEESDVATNIDTPEATFETTIETIAATNEESSAELLDQVGRDPSSRIRKNHSTGQMIGGVLKELEQEAKNHSTIKKW